ncbi:MAG: diaminopimelate epimerase [Oscillospiraceae bacterium]|jgi:diaminopimelate epimerase|nr:diaminopimelate epimerase [Oscillospiraceae bacterium]
MNFTKMHGLGNDYLYVYGEVPDNIAELSQKLSERHFGAGADGMIYISPSAAADFKMRIFNADGSEAKMCGNGIRCVGKYVYDKGYTDKTQLTVETLSGIKKLDMQVRCGKIKSVTVDMGPAEVGADIELRVSDRTVTGTPVSVGNPHFVVFVDDIASAPLHTLGPLLEKHEAFPGGVNVEFVQPLGEGRLRMRVWERGSGVTLACGTGACASAAAAVKKGYCRAYAPVSVELDGGVLEVTVGNGENVMMSGPAETVYEGECAV